MCVKEPKSLFRKRDLVEKMMLIVFYIRMKVYTITIHQGSKEDCPNPAKKES